MARILMDLDGTVCKTYERAEELADEAFCRIFGPLSIPWQTLLDPDDHFWDTARGQFVLSLFHTPGFYASLEPYPGKNNLFLLCKENNIFFFSSRSEELRKVTVSWLQSFCISHWTPKLLGYDPTGEKKLAWANELGGVDLIVEDDPRVAHLFIENGFTVFLRDQPYNQNLSQHRNLHRFTSWDDVRHYAAALRSSLQEEVPESPNPDPTYHGHPEFYRIIDELKTLHSAKSHDYSRDGDPFFNFRMCEEMGLSAWKGALVRISDKISRLMMFAKKEKLEVKGESVEDTFRDLAVYSILAMILFREGERAADGQ